MAHKEVLLIEDVESLGRSGEIVRVRPGYARNYLIPQGYGMAATKGALLLQERLVAERAKKAQIDKAEAEKHAEQIVGLNATHVVKVDQEGHMYGSVTQGDIAELLNQQLNLGLEKRAVQLKHPIKTTGIHNVQVKLKEGVLAQLTLKVMSEEGFEASQEEVK